MSTATDQFARTFRQHNHIHCVTDNRQMENCHGFTLQPVIVYCSTGIICCRTRCRLLSNDREQASGLLLLTKRQLAQRHNTRSVRSPAVTSRLNCQWRLNFLT